MKINASEIRVGMLLEYKNDLWEVLKTQHVKPGKGGAFAQVEMKSVNKNTKLNERFRSSETVEKASLDEIKYNFLFEDENNYIFMDPKSFEQIEIKKAIIGEKGKLLTENLEVTISIFNDTPITIDLPNQITCKIKETDVALKGQTVSSSYKPATLINGLNIQVPPFIEVDDEVVIDTRNLEYIKKSEHMNSISANLNIMIKASEKASKVLVRDFGEIEKLQVKKKGPTDFVTNADIKVEKIIIEELKKARPNYSFITEENGIKINKDKNNTWIIDPIDGTVNFLHGIPHFAISIAHKSENEIISGLIFDPIKNEMFYAEKNNGAFFNNHRIRVSKKNDLNECLFVTGGKLNREIELPYRKSGCAALDMAYVASGRYDGYFQNKLNLWDIAAGIIIIKEAGGLINEIDLSINENIKVIASSTDINEKMLEKLNNF